MGIIDTKDVTWQNIFKTTGLNYDTILLAIKKLRGSHRVTDENPEETKQPKLGLIIDAPVTEGEPEKLEETRQLQENGGIIAGGWGSVKVFCCNPVEDPRRARASQRFAE